MRSNRMGAGWNNPYMGYHSGLGSRLLEWSLSRRVRLAPYGYGYGYGGLRRLGYGLGYGGFGGGLGFGLGHGPGMGAFVLDVRPDALQLGLLELYNPYYGGGLRRRGNDARRPAADRLRLFPADRSPRAHRPSRAVADQAVTTFDSAREAFKAGDYAKALDLVDQAIKSMPNDPTLHEFRARPCSPSSGTTRRPPPFMPCCRPAPAGIGRP